MDFLRSLFGGGSSRPPSDGRGMYFYVQPDGCDEVVRIRVDPANEAGIDDEGGYTARKGVYGTRCFKAAELVVRFNEQRSFVTAEVEGGALVDDAAWQAWQGQAAQGS